MNDPSLKVSSQKGRKETTSHVLLGSCRMGKTFPQQDIGERILKIQGRQLSGESASGPGVPAKVGQQGIMEGEQGWAESSERNPAQSESSPGSCGPGMARPRIVRETAQ